MIAMWFGNLTLLHQLALEYNAIIETATLNSVQKDINCSNTIGDDDEEEIDDQMTDIENEMILLMAVGSNKRRSTIDIPAPKHKRPKYDLTSKLHFTDPVTMERKPFTYEYSIWYMNYVLHPHPETKKWRKMFRKQFRMKYELFLDIEAQSIRSLYHLSKLKKIKVQFVKSSRKMYKTIIPNGVGKVHVF